jgi:ubiquinone/menaquinone biosynthesis C-methylase UbiE
VKTVLENRVGFYSRVIFPWLCDFGLDRPPVAEQRRKLLESAAGSVLEIGFGTGLNLPHYPQGVREIAALDPNPGMTRRAQRRINDTGIKINHFALSGERLPFEDNRFHTVVSTFTLCSVADVVRSVAEIYRVLMPGGRFLFLEHGLSTEIQVQRWQRRLNWLQMLVGDGCRLDRNVKELVAGQPFSLVQSSEFYLKTLPKTHGFIFRGVAIK